jgi:hypothetical protein
LEILKTELEAKIEISHKELEAKIEKGNSKDRQKVYYHVYYLSFFIIFINKDAVKLIIKFLTFTK